MPPYWVHATVNGGANRPMTFGAWCVRDYGFEYGQVRAHGGIAYFPYVEDGGIRWRENPAYRCHGLTERGPREYTEFGIRRGVPVYAQFREQRDRFDFVTRPQDYQHLWEGFRP